MVAAFPHPPAAAGNPPPPSEQQHAVTLHCLLAQCSCPLAVSKGRPVTALTASLRLPRCP